METKTDIRYNKNIKQDGGGSYNNVTYGILLKLTNPTLLIQLSWIKSSGT